MINDVDRQYNALVKDIIENGVDKETRAGKVRSVFGRMLRFNLQQGLPMLTTKKVFSKGVIHELLWFIKGDTNIKYLVENGVNIWTDDAYRWYKTIVERSEKIEPNNIQIVDKETFVQNVLKRRKLKLVSDNYTRFEYRFGDLGPVYGKQWRDLTNSEGIPVDQLKNIIKTLRSNPNDRRMLCVAFNPQQIQTMALPPCHVMFQFYATPLSLDERNKMVNDGYYYQEDELDGLEVPKYKLSCMWTQRSCDVGLGLPFNILSYAILTHMVAQCVNMIPDELIGSFGDIHIYENHVESLEEQIEREPYQNLPILVLNDKIKVIDGFTFDDIKIEGYESHPAIKMPLSVG